MDKDLLQAVEYFIRYPQDASPPKIRGLMVKIKESVMRSERLGNALGEIPEGVIDEIVKSLGTALITKQPKNMEEWKDAWKQHVMYIARELRLAARPAITGEWIIETIKLFEHALDTEHAEAILRERLEDLKVEIKEVKS